MTGYTNSRQSTAWSKHIAAGNFPAFLFAFLSVFAVHPVVDGTPHFPVRPLFSAYAQRKRSKYDSQEKSEAGREFGQGFAGNGVCEAEVYPVDAGRH